MARSRGGKRAPVAPVRVRSARRSGAAVVWRTARSRATTRSAPRRRWCGSRCAPRSPTGRPEPKVVVVDDWAIDAPKTKDAVKLLEAIGLRTKGEREARVLVVLFRTDENAWKSLRNLGERVQIVLPEELNTYDVLLNDWLVFSQPALETTIARLGDAKVSASKVEVRRR